MDADGERQTVKKDKNKKITIIKNDITFRAEVLVKTKGNQLTGVMFNVVTPA